MGKTAGADEQRGKITYPAVVGLNRSKEIQAELTEAAIESLGSFGSGAEPLRRIARYIVERNK